MRRVEVNGLVFGEGEMKICIPVCEKTLKEAVREVREIKKTKAQMVEWRMDYFEEDIASSAEAIFEAAGHMPVLCTFRTKAEGGEKDIDAESYFALYEELAARGAKMVHLELAICGAYEAYAFQFIAALHAMGVVVVISSHNFENTPPREEIKQTYELMRMLDADLPKVAVTPKDQRDVMTLFTAMAEVSETCWPLIGISMGGIGRVSRVRGSIFGCAITFATREKASAPGQIDVETLVRLMANG